MAFVSTALKAWNGKLFSRLTYLNKQGKFKRGLSINEITKAIVEEESDLGFIFKVLKALEERAELESGPTTFVTKALRDEHFLRKRISWLNTHGDLKQKIVFDKLMEGTPVQDMVA